ncbi:MAG: hypothetical protein AAGD18_18085 [Actinomycetota bacterium]
MTSALRYPGRAGHVVVPRADRRSMWDGLGLYTPSRPRAVWLHRVASAAMRLGLGAVIAREPWTPPEDWPLAVWRREVPGADTLLGAYERPQASRDGGAALLGGDGRRVALVKVRRAPAPELEHEALVLDTVARARPRSFAVPEVLASGIDDGYAWVATSTIPRDHRSVPDLAAGVTEEISELLAPLDLEGDGDASHGDLTPWNVRRAGGTVWIFDWEDAARRPAGADATLHHAWMVLLGVEEPRACPADAVRHWQAVVAGRSTSDTDHDANLALAEVLASLITA